MVREARGGPFQVSASEIMSRSGIDPLFSTTTALVTLPKLSVVTRTTACASALLFFAARESGGGAAFETAASSRATVRVECSAAADVFAVRQTETIATNSFFITRRAIDRLAIRRAQNNAQAWWSSVCRFAASVIAAQTPPNNLCAAVLESAR